MSALRAISVVTTSRADLSILLPVMSRIDDHPSLKLEVLVTGMHLAEGHEAGLKPLEESSFTIAKKIPTILEESAQGVADAISRGVNGFSHYFASNTPDVLVVLGDRYDMFPAVIAALPFNIPVAHLHGGEVATGAIDESIRHAVSKLSHLHFVAADAFKSRLIAMGEEPWRIFKSGAPGLDALDIAPKIDRQELASAVGLPDEGPFSLVTLHPETLATLSPEQQAHILIDAAEKISHAMVITAPNADSGGQVIRQLLQQFADQRENVVLLESAGPKIYPNLLRHCSVVVGNSSSGILEAGYFAKAVINIGHRQEGRPMGDNINSIDWDSSKIEKYWADCLQPDKKIKFDRSTHPYGFGGAPKIIADTLASITLGPELILKKFTDIKNGTIAA